VNAVKEAPATASGIGGKKGLSRVERAPDAKAMKANAARIVEATATSGPTPARDVAMGVTAARPEATSPRSSPHLAGKLIAECARATIQMDAPAPACVIAAREV
jgi:hypothetical protein